MYESSVLYLQLHYHGVGSLRLLRRNLFNNIAQHTEFCYANFMGVRICRVASVVGLVPLGVVEQGNEVIQSFGDIDPANRSQKAMF